MISDEDLEIEEEKHQKEFEILKAPFWMNLTKFNFCDGDEDDEAVQILTENLLQSCVNHGIKSLVFTKCKFPLITEENVQNIEIITPEENLRPLYGISFIKCEFEESKQYDKADQIGLLLNCEGLPSRSPSGDPQQVGGGISSITFKNNGFSEVEMAKLKVYLCYAENLMIYEEN
ncbi:unnamed protein product [Moneuplotes crassus]|uniref:Uncharacterized protein n=1 Tax=Euplotes crassus TaxID=5936 RepID=A0AAD2D8M9_EUPCR|nr:unnamed protein product [Moneuplotes crassus]